MTSPRVFQVLAAMQAADAVGTAIPIPYIGACLDDVRFPRDRRWILVSAKTASALGLASVSRLPALARLTTFMLTVYFVLAVGYHVRANDLGRNALSAASLLATYAALTVTGPSAERR